MISKERMKRISALLLAVMMTLSMSDFVLEEVFAESGDAGDVPETVLEGALEGKTAAADAAADADLTADAVSDDDLDGDTASEARKSGSTAALLAEGDSEGSGQGDSGQGGSGDSGQGGSGDSGQGDSGQGGSGDSGQGDSDQGGSGDSGQGDSGQGGSGDSGQGDSGQGGSGDSGQGDSGQGGSGDSGQGDSGQGGSQDQSQDTPAPAPATEPEPEIADIEIDVDENLDGTMKLSWDPVENAASYTITKEACSVNKTSMKFPEEQASIGLGGTEYTFTGLYPGRIYTFTVTALNSSNEVIGQTAEPLDEQPILSSVTPKVRTSRAIDAKKKKVNGSKDLRTVIGEKYNGYAVVQGGCTDGTFAYYLMVSPRTQHGRVAKVNMSTGTLVKVSDVLDTWHGNGMAYDSRRHQLVVNARNEGTVKRKQELTCIDADSLTIIPERQKKVSYTYFKNDTTNFSYTERKRGFTNVTYNEKYDVYVCMQRTRHNLIVVDPDTFKVLGLIQTKINAKYPGSYQAMDIDDQYVYQLLSAEGKKQPYNLILALDWNAEQLLDSEGHRREYVPEKWNALNGKKPVAVYRIRTPYEAENIYHTTDAYGNTHFYLSEYNNNFTYIKKTYKIKKKVKWKKVTKKIKKKVKWKKVKKKVKWKKVKTKDGKYKWKYKTKKVWKYKTKIVKKKVWKYKIKYKKKTKIVGSYYNRQCLMYDLGII